MKDYPHTDVLVDKILRDARTAASVKLHPSDKPGLEWPQRAESNIF
jgi:hypothetical protein